MENTIAPIGTYAPDFELPGVDGSVHHLARYLETHRAIAVIMMGNRCPYVQLYLDRIKQLQIEFQSQHFTLIGINANDDRQFPADSFEQMKLFAASNGLNFPYLRDVTQDVARTFEAERTPEAFLIDQSGVVRYRGAIDDSPSDPGRIRAPFLRNAIAQLLATGAVQIRPTRATGSALKWRD